MDRLLAFYLLLLVAVIVSFAVMVSADQPISISVHGKLLADESSANEGRFWIEGEDSTPLCAIPESYLATWLHGSIGKQATLSIEVKP